MSVFTGKDVLIKPVYDVGNFGEDVQVPLGAFENNNVQTITFSSATFDQATDGGIIDVERLDSVISDTDTGVILHEGNDTAFDQTYQYLTDMSAMIYKTEVFAAVGLNVSAYTSGSFNIDSVTLNVTENRPDGSVVKEILGDKVIASGLSALTGTGTQIFLFTAHISTPYRLSNGNYLRVRVRINETTGSGTRQVGMIPLYCFIPNAVAKMFIYSQAIAHAHPTLDHAFPVFRDSNKEQLLDFSGLDIQKVERHGN